MAFLHRDDVSLYYDLRPGAGTPMVFIHGWCCDHSYFSPQLSYFGEKGRTTLALDLRGHGRSDKPLQAYSMGAFADDVAWMCRELALAKPVLVGHSMGGIVAYDVAARYPALASAIVMIDSAVVRPAAAKAAGPAILDALRSPRYAEVLRDLMTKGFFIPSDDAGRRNAILDAMTATPQHVMASAYQGLLDYDPEAGRGRIRVPSLFIAANEPTPRADLVALRDLIPELHEGKTVGSGHFCTVEVPDQINAMIERFERVARA